MIIYTSEDRTCFVCPKRAFPLGPSRKLGAKRWRPMLSMQFQFTKDVPQGGSPFTAPHTYLCSQ